MSFSRTHMFFITQFGANELQPDAHVLYQTGVNAPARLRTHDVHQMCAQFLLILVLLERVSTQRIQPLKLRSFRGPGRQHRPQNLFNNACDSQLDRFDSSEEIPKPNAFVNYAMTGVLERHIAFSRRIHTDFLRVAATAVNCGA